MKKSETRILEMLVSVRQYMLLRIASFPVGSRGHELYIAVDTSIKNMEQHSTTQALHAHALKEKTVQKRVAYNTLRKLMDAISRTARSMSRETPGLEEKFRLPSNRDRQTWLATARAFVTEAEPLADEFGRRGMPADFIDDLRARILAVEQTQDSQAQRSAERVASTASVAGAAEQGFEVVRELDAIVRNIYAGNDAEVAAWGSASHVARAPHHAVVETEAPPAQPAPTQG